MYIKSYKDVKYLIYSPKRKSTSSSVRSRR